MRELRVEDALLYLDQVKVEFGDRPQIYNEFLDIMKTFKTQQIDTPGVIRRVSNLFQGNKRLVLGFNTFLPEGYKIELPLDGDGPPIAVFRAPGETITHILTGPGAPPMPGSLASADPQHAAVAPPSVASAVASFPPHVGQGPLRAGPPLSHADVAGLGDRGHNPVAGLESAYPPQLGFKMTQEDKIKIARLENQRQMEAAAHDAAARARLEQQTHGVVGSPMMGHSEVTSMAHAGLPGLGQAQQQPVPDTKVPARMSSSVAAQHPPVAAVAQQPPAQAQLEQPPQEPQQPGMEFDHAINYVTTIKKRFANEPETYKKFLEILHTYQKEQRGIKEVLEEVSALFSEHPDLLKEFTYFLPDAVQSEAKAQLDQAAKEAEARLRAKASKQAIMQQAQGVQREAAPSEHSPSPSPTQTTPEIKYSYKLTRAKPAANPIPFGATMGRSKEREFDIFRTVVYGSISFAPIRPLRKSALHAAQGAMKNGRPTMLPPLPRQPNTAETSFFERAKKHLNRKELAPDKPSTTRVRHTPYMEFLKCLHMFGGGVLNKDELLLLLRGLFMQGHAPKSGVNAGGGASNPQIANDAQDLMKELEDIMVGRGPYADQQAYMKDKSKYGAKRTRDFDYRECERPTPSYAMLPSDYSVALFMSHHGQLDNDAPSLNEAMVCVGATKMPGTSSPEDYDAIKIRRNVYEEAMFRIEDERFEVDMAIERNALAMRQIEPIAEEIAMLRENEEKDGQPIGRLQYTLKNRSINSIQLNAIGRVYGEKGDEVLEYLARNPLAAVPIVYQRLRQKDQEWRKQKSDLMAKWKSITESNYEGSMDFLCYQNRREIEKASTNDRLLEEVKKARSFCSSLEKRSGSSVNFGLSSPDRSAVLYEPYAVVEMKPASIVHQFAVSLLSEQVIKSTVKSKSNREKVGRLWTEFVMPFFDYSAHWIVDEARESFQGEINNTVVRYATGQHVRTAFGDGVVLAYLPEEEPAGPRYRVKLPYGISYLRAYAIMHGIENPDGTKYVRRDGVMEKDMDVSTEDPTAAKLDKKFKLLFGSENIYLFMRLYSSLVSLLGEIESYIRAEPTVADPASNYYNPMKSDEEKKDLRLDFVAVMTNLKRVISGKLSLKEFEGFCRRVSPDIVHKMAALPKLVERGGSMLLKAAEEDLLLQLFDFCQYSGTNPIQLRDKCLTLSPDAAFRIQYNTNNGRLYFSYLPESEILSTAPVDDDDDDDEAMEDGDVESDDDDDDVMDVEDEEEDLRQVKRAKMK